MTMMTKMKMNKVTVFVPWEYYAPVNKVIKKSEVKFYPFVKCFGGYRVTYETDSNELACFLKLKYDINTVY